MSLARRRQDRRIIAAIRSIARRCGYAVGVHGSQGPKDLDLIAAPWTTAAVSPEALIQAITTAPGLLLGVAVRATQGPPKPHGRLAWILVHRELRQSIYRWRHVDISVMPGGSDVAALDYVKSGSQTAQSPGTAVS